MQQITLTSQLRVEGFSPAETRARVRSGELERVRQGAYGRPDPDATAEERHRRRLAAALVQHSSEAVASHLSAAVVHGLPVWSSALQQVHLTRPRTGGGKVLAGVELHASALPAGQVTRRDGTPRDHGRADGRRPLPQSAARAGRRGR